MRKLLLMAAVASVALTSCVSEMDDKGYPSDKTSPVTFSYPVVKPNTRSVAGEMGNPYSTLERFNVYAAWSKTNFATWEGSTLYMKNVTCRYNGNSGTANNATFEPMGGVYYWPKNGYLTFAAYSPADAKGTIHYGATGLTITNFKVNANGISKKEFGKTTTPSENVQYDLMYADRVIDQTKGDLNTGANYDGVNLNFKHALASVKFTAKLGAEYKNTTVKLKNIKLTGITSNGDFKEGIVTETEAGTPSWTAATAGAKTADFVAYDNAGEVVSATAKKLTEFTDGKDFIMIPQEFATADAKISISWSITNAQNVEIEQTDSFNLQDIKFDSASNGNWEIGKRYTYNIIIALDKIYFNPTVDTWKDANGGDINVK